MNIKNKAQSKFIKGMLVASTAIVLGACSQANKDSASTVSVSFKMTSSGNAATVATLKPSFWNLLLNRAMAFMPSSIVDSNGATVTLNEAWVVIKEIEFKQEEVAGTDEVDGAEVEFEGPYYVDLLSSTPLALDTVSIPDQAIRRIKMKLHKAESTAPASAPAGINGNSIYVSGSVGANNFVVQMDDSTEFEIGGPTAVSATNGGDLLAQINLADVFKQIDLSGVTNNEVISSASRHSGTNLCLAIDASANDIYTCIRKGLEKHADFGEDSNGDDSLESADDDTVKE